jgi:hypothetical protein
LHPLTMARRSGIVPAAIGGNSPLFAVAGPAQERAILSQKTCSEPRARMPY